MELRRIEFLPDDVRSYLRNVSVGLIVGGALAIALSMPKWYGLIPFAIGVILGVIGCMRIRETH